MLEQVDKALSKSAVRKGVRVRVPLPARTRMVTKTVVPGCHGRQVHDLDTRRRTIAMLELGLTRRDVCPSCRWATTAPTGGSSGSSPGIDPMSSSAFDAR